MITVLSPAKKLSKECVKKTENHNLPRFLDQSSELVSQLKDMEPADLMSLMGISENLAILNWERMQNWNRSLRTDSSMESAYCFLGDTYTGLDAESLDDNDLDFAQKHTRILSGLYGILRPLDLMMPYRLEMGTKFEFNNYKNLYEFWTEKITEKIVSECKPDELLINLASNEYFSAINLGKIKSEIITPKFLDFKNGKLKMISFYAKKARGLMVRFLIDNNITKLEGILKFNLEGYSYSESETNNLNQPVFVR